MIQIGFGAIAGDIIGSTYERHNHKGKDIELFREGSHFTDDTVMTIATADAILHGGKTEDFAKAYKKWGRAYPDAGYGRGFKIWLNGDSLKPYGSYGNGAVMRVSPCVWASDNLDEVLELARKSAVATHYHAEATRGAACVADLIYHANSSKADGAIKSNLLSIAKDKYHYPISEDWRLDDIRPGFKFDSSCQGTVPYALQAVLEADGFEDAIRNAISLGGDSDTLAAVAGSIAEPLWGIPDDIFKKTFSYLDAEMRKVLFNFNEKVLMGR